jgi:lysophospholipase L1-like esterase
MSSGLAAMLRVMLLCCIASCSTAAFGAAEGSNVGLADVSDNIDDIGATVSNLIARVNQMNATFTAAIAAINTKISRQSVTDEMHAQHHKLAAGTLLDEIKQEQGESQRLHAAAFAIELARARTALVPAVREKGEAGVGTRKPPPQPEADGGATERSWIKINSTEYWSGLESPAQRESNWLDPRWAALTRQFSQGISPEPWQLQVAAGKLRLKLGITVVVFGGSVSQGCGGGRGGGWVSQFRRWLEEAHPSAHHNIITIATGGAGSEFVYSCGVTNQAEIQHADLVVMEYAVNDPPDASMCGRDQDAETELALTSQRLLNIAREQPLGAQRVVFLSWFSKWNLFRAGACGSTRYSKCADGCATDRKLNCSEPPCVEAAAIQAARLTGAAHISLYSLLAPSARQWSMAGDHLFYDHMHPSIAGHLLLANALASALDWAVRHPNDNDKKTIPPPTTPTDSTSTVVQHPKCYTTQETIMAHVTKNSGFSWMIEHTKSGRKKPGLVATKEGAQVTFFVSQRDPASNRIALGFLKSYQHMGKAGVSVNCSDGFSLNTVIDAHHNEKTSVQAFMEPRTGGIVTTDSSPCNLTVTVLKDSSCPSKEHKFKILLVGDLPGIPEGMFVSYKLVHEDT